MEGLALGVICGVWAFMWCNVLTAHGMIFNFLPRWYWSRFAGKGWAEWLAKPLFDCAVCNAFWVFIIANGLVSQGGNSCFEFGFTFMGITAALFSSYALTRHYEN